MDRYPEWPNLATMMFDLSRVWAGRPMLRHFRYDAWESISWGEFGRQAAAVASGLRRAGIAAGDRVLIVSENRPEYPIAETALMAIRAVPVPTYVTNTAADHAHVLRDSGARVAIVSRAALAERVLEGAGLAGGLDLIVVMEDFVPPPGARVLHWDALLLDPPDPMALIAEAAAIPIDTLACLIYTSGTGGAPRGVMLPHRCILSNCRGAFTHLRSLNLKDDVYLSFLPLSHAYEHTAGQFFLLSVGTEIAYARGLEHLAADMLAVRPTIMTMVPRVLEVLRGRILTQLQRIPPWRRFLFERSIAVGLKQLDRGTLGVADWCWDRVIGARVRAEVGARFGGRFRAAMSGGARLEPEVGRFFLALGMDVMQGYGQTEAGPVISANAPDAMRIDSVGRVLPGVELRIAEDGEILVRGGLVMDGYWGQPEATAAAIRDGWLHTGDIGTLDAEGYLRITDRKKDIIVLSGGDNVSPARIEGLLMNEPEIAQAVVAGEGKPGLAALVVPAEGYDDMAVALAVSRVNKRLSVVERIRKHTAVAPFTVENGLMTPTHKIRRQLAIRAYEDAL